MKQTKPIVEITLTRADPSGTRAVETAADALGALLADVLLRMADARVAAERTVSADELDKLAGDTWARVKAACGNALGQHRSAGATAIKAAVATREEAARRAKPLPRERHVEFIREGGKLKAKVIEMPRSRAGR